jgi:DNA-binding NarL/FixJ family response regulator
VRFPASRYGGVLRRSAAGRHARTVRTAIPAWTRTFIRAVAAGETLIRPAVTERVLRGFEHVRRDFDSLDPPDPLTKREVEILRLMAGGYSNREIADALGTAEGTIKNHASSILSKLGVRDRTRAVLKSLERGYI